VRLSVEEKNLARENILRFISDHPVESQNTIHYWRRFFGVFAHISGVAYVLIVLAVLSLLIGGGIAIGADDALPGATLYPVKVNIKEEFHAFFVSSDEERVNFEIQRIANRLDEIEDLVRNHTFDTQAQEAVESSLESHIAMIKDQILLFEDQGNMDAALAIGTKLDMVLKNHDQLLTTTIQNQDTHTEIAQIAVRMRFLAALAERNKLADENKIVQTAKQNLLLVTQKDLASAQKNLAETYAFFENNMSHLGGQEMTYLKSKFSSVDALVVQSRVKIEAGKYEDAQVLLVRVATLIQEIRSYIQANSKK
jgi:hypothetical protein